MFGAYACRKGNAYGARMQRGYARKMTSLPPVQARRAARLKAALTEFDNNIAEMARVVDTPRPHLSALIHGSKGCGNELASKIEQRLNKPAGWLDQEEVSTMPSLLGVADNVGLGAYTDSISLARAVSDRAPIIPPQKLSWEGLVSAVFEGQFILEIHGDALAPGYLPGQSGIWECGPTAQPGQPVLIKMPGPTFALRLYEDRGGTWAGVSTRPGHRTLTPAADAAEIVARLRYLDLG